MAVIQCGTIKHAKGEFKITWNDVSKVVQVENVNEPAMRTTQFAPHVENIEQAAEEALEMILEAYGG